MKNKNLILFIAVLLAIIPISYAFESPKYSIDVDVSTKGIDVNINQPGIDVNITNKTACDSTETMCSGTTYYTCVNQVWVNQGQVNGKCEYVVYTTPINGGGNNIQYSGGGGYYQTPVQNISFGNNNLQKEVEYTFEVNSKSHTLKLTNVGNDYVDLEIFSIPQNIRLKIGETKEIDLNNDSVNDISTELISITNQKAEIKLSKIERSNVVANNDEFSSNGNSQDSKKVDGQNGFSRITGAVVGTLGTAGTILVIVFIILVVGFALAVNAERKAAAK